jgi:DNA relaxase NicK
VTHERFVSAHAAGRFSAGGRPPAMQMITSTDPRAGRTCTVGRRDSDKFVRGYEKGFQLASLLPPTLGAGLQAIDGHALEDIYRVELELKAESRPVPWDVIDRRDQYFAGSYPFCADLLPNVEADILMRRPERQPQRDLMAALENCRVQYGATLYTALRCYAGDLSAVWDHIVGDHHNRDLVEAGVLLVEHDPDERLVPFKAH